MGLWSRAKGIAGAKASKALDRAENPNETLDYSYEKQLDLLQQVKRGVAEVATQRKRLELQATALQKTAETLQTQAVQALELSREDLAREALTRRAAIGTQLQVLNDQHSQLKAEEEKLAATATALQARVETFRTQKETMKASYTAAQAQTRVSEALTGISTEFGDVGQAMQRASDKTEAMRARAGALDELLASGALSDPMAHPGDDIQRQLNQLSADSSVDLELARIRASLPGAAASAAPEALPPAAPAPRA